MSIKNLTPKSVEIIKKEEKKISRYNGICEEKGFGKSGVVLMLFIKGN